jgi:hypothetical protein
VSFTALYIQQFLMLHSYFWLDVLLCHYEAHWLNNTSSNLVNKANWVHNLILVYLSISTCFRWLCTNHQEKQLCLCDTWCLLLCVDDCLVYRVEWNIYISWFIYLPKPMCSGLLYCVCILIHLSSLLFLWFLIFGLVQDLFLSHVANF